MWYDVFIFAELYKLSIVYIYIVNSKLYILHVFITKCLNCKLANICIINDVISWVRFLETLFLNSIKFLLRRLGQKWYDEPK